VLASLRQPESVVPGATAYSLISIAGMFPFYAFVVARQSLQAMKLVRPVVVAMVVANLANVALNYVFIFGKLGLPAMGVVGAAWATQISRWIMLVAALWGGWRFLAPHLTGWRRDTIRFEPLKRMLALGSPIGIQHLLEFGVFGVVGLMMGWIGPVAMAGHQVALNLASFTFMVPMGVSAAAAVLVGHAVGKGDAPEARRAALAGLACGLGFMALSAAGMLAAPGFFAGLYTDQPDVAAVAMSLIPVAGVFQLFDGAQVVSIGILRGAGDTRTPMVINVVGFWLLGLPVSLLLAFRVGLGSTGLWWGLVLGLAVVALLLLVRVRLKLAGRLDRVVIDREAVTASP
jgi:MATE family multidrug resistance protein